MPSQFFGLNIAYTGLLASNAAINTTSNNISNVHTPGYSRQQVVQQAGNALQVFEKYGCAGAGVETLAIERVRDEFYDVKYWNNNTKAGEYDIKQYYMNQIETYFDDAGVNAGFKTVFDKLMINAMQALLNDPSSSAAKNQFIGFAGDLVKYFNGQAGNLENLQKDVNQEIKLKVDEVNALAGEIATLNEQINIIEMGSGKANELRDRRTLLLDQLSEIVDVEVTEMPIIDTNNPERETGGTRYIIKIAGGNMLVDGNEYNGLECVARNSYEKVNQTDIDGLYDVYWSNGQKFNLYNPNMGGNLVGLIQMREGNNGEYFSGKITGIGNVTGDDNINRDTVTVTVTKGYLQDINKCNLSDQGGVIDLGNQLFYYDSWEYTSTFDSNGDEVCSYTFTLSDNSKNSTRITNDRVNKEASIGKSINYQGIPYYMSQMNEWVRTFSQKFNDILKSGYSGDNPGCILFTGDQKTSGDQLDFPDGSRYEHQDYQTYLAKVKDLVDNHGLTDADARKQAAITVNVNDDSYYALNAKNFSILTAMLNDPTLLATKKNPGTDVENDDLLLELKDMAYNSDKMSFRGCNASEFLQCILSDVALNASRANTFAETFRNMANTIDNQRISKSGVDEDEEALNLVKFQNSFNLASKMIQVLTEIYDQLILQTGV